MRRIKRALCLMVSLALLAIAVFAAALADEAVGDEGTLSGGEESEQEQQQNENNGNGSESGDGNDQGNASGGSSEGSSSEGGSGSDQGEGSQGDSGSDEGGGSQGGSGSDEGGGSGSDDGSDQGEGSQGGSNSDEGGGSQGGSGSDQGGGSQGGEAPGSEPDGDSGDGEATEPTAAPTEAPTVTPTPSPTPEPTEAPTPDPTAEPTIEPTIEPTVEPTIEPTEAPTPSPTPRAEATLTLSIAEPLGLEAKDGIWQIDPAQVPALTFAWHCDGACDSYRITVSGDVLDIETGDNALALPVTSLPAGGYVVTVAAKADGETVATAQLAFEILASEKQDPEEQQGEGRQKGEQEQQQQPQGQGGGGSRPSGGGKGGSGDGAEAEQGFHVTPGTALTSAHSSGSKDLRLYGSVNLSIDGEGVMTTLTLGDDVLDIRLDGGGTFTAALDGARLALTPEEATDAWVLNGRALKALAKSGIDAIGLSLNGETIEFPTQPALEGDLYGRLCSAGLVSKDYDFYISIDGIRVRVAGETYLLRGNELSIPEG